VRPLVDGKQIEYIGEADRVIKNALLSRARALLFPIQWDEPFGLVMIEAMACGTPVIAFDGGAVPEIVRNGVNGWICADVAEMAARAATATATPRACRDFVEARFSIDAMTDRYLNVYEHALMGTTVEPSATAELEA
jgi:glycosyltransferase involved in cell wall biosynthesis